jgi:hypothetical protein
MFKLDKWTPLFACLSTIPLEVGLRDPWQATGFLGLSVRGAAVVLHGLHPATNAIRLNV